jgi:hypothetical protein
MDPPMIVGMTGIFKWIDGRASMPAKAYILGHKAPQCDFGL